MASNNRATQINKVLKVAKKHFKPAGFPSDRNLLQHLIFACCAENSLYDVVEEVFATLSNDYYDWNEVRVTSIRELSQVMKALNDPEEAATRLKRVLQSVFETHYTFDLEPMKKQNIGQTVKQLEKYNGTTRYTVNFVVQNALGGHAIPINKGLLESMRVVGVVSDNEAKKGTVPGLERAVPKTKGVEVGTMLHQIGVELRRSPYGPVIRKLLLEIEPGCKENLPKRPSKKVEPPPKPEKKPEKKTAKAAEKKSAAKEAKEAAKGKGTKKVESKPKPTKKPSDKPAASSKSKKKSVTKAASPKAPAKKKTVKKKKVVKKKTPAKKTPAKKKKTTKKPAAQGKKKATGKKTDQTQAQVVHWQAIARSKYSSSAARHTRITTNHS